MTTTSLPDPCQAYLRFAIDVVEEAKLSFPEDDQHPVAAAKAYLDGTLGEEGYRARADHWFKQLMPRMAEEGRPTRMLRLALCLLSATPDQAEGIDDHFDFLVELLQQLEVDDDLLRSKMAAHSSRPFAP